MQMGLIIHAAKLVLCKCRSHGVIVYGDGSKSEEFYSIEDARAEIVDALTAGKILPAEADFLRDDIKQSSMVSETTFDFLHQAVEGLGEFVARQAGEEQTAPEEMPASPRVLH
jgi:hypothetical protein